MSTTPARTHRPDRPAGASRAPASRRPLTPDLPSLMGNRAFTSLVLQRCGGAPEPCPCHEGAPPEIQRAPAGSGGLRVGAADDAYEKEAARVAAKVMSDLGRGARPVGPIAAATPVVQRATDDDVDLQDDVPDLQAAARPGGPRSASASVAGYVGSLGSAGGQPLPAATRHMLEPRFGRDFGGVRVHTDASASAAAHAVHASAFTVGSHIVFASGRYSPSTVAGQALLAHELTHVIQQSGGRARPVIQRAPWGTCPTGKRLSARARPFRYGPAEYQMLDYYQSRRGYREVASNRNKFWEIDASSWSGEPARMLRAFQKQYMSHKGPVRRRSVQPADKVPAPAGSGSVLDAIGGSDAAIDLVASELQPDIIDFRKREIYDVTTTGMATAKRVKVSAYAGLATGITGVPWTAGRTLQAPRLFYMTRMHMPGELICFGKTDLTHYPGVLAYEVISTKKDDKKKDKKKKDKKGKKKDKKGKKKDKKKQQPKKKASKKKESKKKESKKDKKDTKKAPGASGGNIGFGIGIFSTGGGSGNATLGVSVMSHGTAYGTVSAGVVYDSTGQAVGAVGAGAASGSSSTGAGVAGAGVSTDSTAIAVGAAGAGKTSGSTAAGAGMAGAGSSKDDTVAGAGVAGHGVSEGNLAAAAGTTGSGDVRGQVGAKAGGGGTTGTAAGGTSGAGPTATGSGTTEPTVSDGPTATGGGTPGTGGTTPGGGTAGGTTTTGGQATSGGVSASGAGQTFGRYGLPIPGQAPGDVDRAVEQAAQMDALLRNATPAQRALMDGLARKQATGTFTVTGPEWVRFMLSASQDVKDEDVPKLLDLEWTPGKITPEELRARIKRVLARKAQPPPGATPARDAKPPKKGARTQAEQAEDDGKAVRKPVDKKPSGQGMTRGKKDDKQPKESAEDRIARLAERAAKMGDYDGSAKGFISYDKNADLTKPVHAALYLPENDPGAGHMVWATADVVVRIKDQGGKRHVTFLESTELVGASSRYAEASTVRGASAELEP